MDVEVKIRFQNRTETILCPEGSNLLELLHQHGYNVYSPCGGKGRCGKCLVRVKGETGARLACQITAAENLEIDLSPAEELVILAEGSSVRFQLDPHVKHAKIRLEQPSLGRRQDYWRMIEERLGVWQIGPGALRRLGELEQKLDLAVTYCRDKVLAVDEAQNSAAGMPYGLAVDIGTTTVVIYLLDLANGAQMGAHAFANPQSRCGADVITRIGYAISRAEGVQELKRLLLDALNRGIGHLAGQHGIDPAGIYHAVFVGNTVMLHTLLGVNAESIARAPYAPVFTGGLEFAARELDLAICPEGIVELLPCVSGYVGADIIADLLAADFESGRWRLLVDIGTNGEIILGNSRRMFACSAAAGPAFEGANITFGMGGVPGAIAGYQLGAGGEIDCQVIGGREPRGICGSGLVDIIAALYLRGFLSPTGAFQGEMPAAEYMGQPAYRVVPGKDIFLTQKDVREYQLAAGAIAAGMKILMGEAGITETDIDKLYLAGGFGNYINPESAAALGLIPRSLLGKVVKLGNGAGAGAKCYLLDRSAKAKVESLRRKITYVELSARPDFQECFMEAMLFPVV